MQEPAQFVSKSNWKKFCTKPRCVLVDQHRCISRKIDKGKSQRLDFARLAGMHT